MTTHQAKKDLAAKLSAVGITFERLSAKTVSFADLARCAPVFVTIHGAAINRDTFNQIEILKPSAGGYIVDFANCTWWS